MKKRIASIILTLSMMLALLPTVALAATDWDVAMDNMAAHYAGETAGQLGGYADFWHTTAMGSYGKVTGTDLLNAAQKQAIGDHLVSQATDWLVYEDGWQVTGGTANYVQSAINGLSALGFDPTEVTTANGESVDLVAALDTLAPQPTIPYFQTQAPYVLLALRQGDKAPAQAEAYINYLMDELAKDSNWSYEWDGVTYTSYDTAAMLVQGLAPYYDRADVKTAVDLALEKLSMAMGENGSLGNAGADIQAIIALAMLGINPATDYRFIKGDVNLMDALQANITPEQDGFVGYSGTYDAYFTKQGFLALTAAKMVAELGTAYNPYDFAETNEIPFVATEATVEIASNTTNPFANTIMVNVTIAGNEEVGMEESAVYVVEGANVATALDGAAKATGLTLTGLEQGFITAVTNTFACKTLEQFSAGPNSGWLFKVNGEQPQAGIGSIALKEGDSVLLYFTEDWTTEMPEPEPKTDFTDVPAGFWGEDAIVTAIEMGWMQGNTDTTFNPNGLTSRATVAMVLYRMADKPALSAAALPFTDVTVNDWFADAVRWAFRNEIVSGTTDTTFAPNAPITREDLATLLYRYSVLMGKDVSKTDSLGQFDDFDQVDTWAMDGVRWAVAEGILTGRTATELAPTGYASRAELATMLGRMG